VLSTALPALAQIEENVTFCGVVTGTPPTDTVTSILVVPNADSAAVPTPRAGAVTVTAALPTVNPIEPLTASVPTWALALTVVAPALVMDAGLSVTVATPVASVKAVADGVMIARVASVLKVTTVFATTAPAAFFKVAFSVPGAPLEMDVTVAPAALMSVSVNVGPVVTVVVVPVVVSLVPVVVPLVVPGERPDPLPQPATMAKYAAKESEAERLEISWLRNFRAKKRKFCTRPSPFTQCA